MKITITLEDTPSGQVRVRVSPSLEKIINERARKKEAFTPAENYTLVMAKAVREASQRLDKYGENNRLSGQSDFSI